MFSRRLFIKKLLPLSILTSPFISSSGSERQLGYFFRDKDKNILFSSGFMSPKGELCIINYESGPFKITSFNQILFFDDCFYRLKPNVPLNKVYNTTSNNSFESWYVDNKYFESITVIDSKLIKSERVLHSVSSKIKFFRSVGEKLNDLISVLDFIPNIEHEDIRKRRSFYDCTESFKMASSFSLSLGVRLYLPSGTNFIKEGGVHPNLGIVGAGISATIIKLAKNSNGLFDATGFWDNGAKWRNDFTCTMEGFSISSEENDFFSYDSTLSNNYDSSSATKETPIKLAFYQRVILRNIEVLWSRGFSFLVTRNKEVYIEQCIAKYSMKDAFRVLGNEQLHITNCSIKHCGDDAITCGTNWNGEDLKPWGTQLDKTVIVSNNVITDSKGIRCLGALNTIISENILQRPKEYGILVGGVDGSEGLNDAGSIIVTKNIINDVISGKIIFDSLGANVANNDEWNAGIVIMTRPVSSEFFSYAPGSYSSAKKEFILPESSYIESAGKKRPSMGMRNITISDNKISRMLQYDGKYSDWDMGHTIFTPTGWVDINLHDLARSGYGVNIRSNSEKTNFAIYGLNIVDNDFYCLNIGIDLSSAKFLGFTKIKDNSFIRVSSIGISIVNNLNIKKNLLTEILGVIDIRNNYLDLDPYRENIHRNLNGVWVSDSIPCGISCGEFSNIHISDNIFRNLALPVSTTSVKKESTKSTVDKYHFPNNIFVNSINKINNVAHENVGIKKLPYGGSFFTENVNEFSAFSIGETNNLINLAMSRMPSEGYYYAGIFVRNINPVIVSNDVFFDEGTILKHSYITSGWLRLTTGSTHEINRDWVACKITTGFSRS